MNEQHENRQAELLHHHHLTELHRGEAWRVRAEGGGSGRGALGAGFPATFPSLLPFPQRHPKYEFQRWNSIILTLAFFSISHNVGVKATLENFPLLNQYYTP